MCLDAKLGLPGTEAARNVHSVHQHCPRMSTDACDNAMACDSEFRIAFTCT